MGVSGRPEEGADGDAALGIDEAGALAFDGVAIDGLDVCEVASHALDGGAYGGVELLHEGE